MKEKFSCSLNGNMWWKPYICMLLFNIFFQFIMQRSESYLELAISMNDIIRDLLLMLASLVLMLIVQSALMVALVKIALSAISLSGIPFRFTGTIGKAIETYTLGIIFVIITFGIYTPWYIRRVTAFWVDNTEFDGERPVFLGRGGSLFKYILLFGFIPIFVCAFLGGLLSLYSEIVMYVVIIGAVILIAAVLSYFYIVWMFNIEWRGIRIKCDAVAGPAVNFLLGQIVLCVITIGIYIPAMMGKVYRYFASCIVLEKDGREYGRGRLDCDTWQVFKFLWKTMLLMIVTLGIYTPWAYANILRYFLNNLYIETGTPLIGAEEKLLTADISQEENRGNPEGSGREENQE
ncbi:DUF898 domain-containing protein [Brucepastera parasyntrophica]|uniref:DUF898 family protein n=1 Tax=Brucepastera parasyntrophica TaxID=2880008 RepID=UPI002108F510|nr:DUF898 family protein [Brucepastera parasyntrophica]ULQ58965.1 DUF898 domain-containing protein [Brucepastera parasyntrophica]